MPISDKLIDQLLDGHSSPEDLLGENGGWGIGSFTFGGDRECEEVPLNES